MMLRLSAILKKEFVSDPFDEFKIAKSIIEAIVCPDLNLVILESLMNLEIKGYSLW